MNILVLDNYDSFTYNLVQYLGELGADVQVHRNDRITVGEIERLAPEKIVISPGPCTPNEAGIGLEPDADGAAEAESSGRTAWIATLPAGRGGADVMRGAYASGVRVRRLAPVVENLEQVFMRILGREGAR